MTLPQTAGFSYAVSTDSLNWNTVPSSNPNVPVAFDNSSGNKFLRLNVRLNDSDSARFSYNYVSVKADSAYFVELSESHEAELSVTANGQTLAVSTELPESYALTVCDLNGRTVFTTNGNGTQAFETTSLHGIYVVVLQCGEQQVVRRCYFGN
jgi:hypothetical protein